MAACGRYGASAVRRGHAADGDPFRGAAQLLLAVKDARWLSPIDAKPFCHAIYLAATLGAALLFMLRFDGAGHLRASFDNRLARLPVKTLPSPWFPT